MAGGEDFNLMEGQPVILAVQDTTSVNYDSRQRLLYCFANRTREPPEKAYSIKEAVDYAGWIGGPKRAPSDGPPGVNPIWIGLQKFYTLFDYRDMFNFSVQGGVLPPHPQFATAGRTMPTQLLGLRHAQRTVPHGFAK